MEKVTAIIPAGNEAVNIEEAIKSLLWADEVYVVVDESSRDNTFELAGSVSPKVRVEKHEYVYSAKQKNWAIPRAAHPWILLMDADERPNEKLVAAVKKTLENPKYDAYEIKRKNVFLGKVLRFGGLANDKVIRLFKKECSYEDKKVHAEITGYKTLGILKGYFEHNTFKNWSDYLLKLHRYSRWGAEQALINNQEAGFINIVLRPIHRFLKQFIFRLGFLDGIPGAVNAYLGAYSAFLKYTLLYEMKRNQNKKIEGEIFREEK
jgi:glycosyltransferase involved in cell wall biosynthesis